MTWQEYETITKYIYETLGKEAGVKIEGHGNDCKVKGKSGVEHQIDVLTSHSDGIHTYKTAIECKYWKETVNKDIVMKVSEIIEDAGINKGVIVSKNGFTPDGITYAEYKNIGLVELREMQEKDWEGRPRLINIKSQIHRPLIIRTIIDNANSDKRESEELEPVVVKIGLANGDQVPFTKYLKEFKQDLRKETVNKIVEKKISLIGAKMINTNTKKSTSINGFTFWGVLAVIKDGLKWHPVDEIWLIMKSIFENKSYTISKNGKIIEDKSQ